MKSGLQDEALEQEADDDIVHIRCEWCDTRPRWAVCGADLRGHEVARSRATCRRCNKLWSIHERLAH